MNTEKSEMGVMSKFFGADRAEPIDVAPPQAPKNLALKALQARIQKVSLSARDERRNSAEVEREIQSLQQQRVTRISLARLEGTDPYTEDLDEKVQALLRQIQDAAAVEAELARMAAAEARDLNQAVFDARRELAEALDARLAEAAERYNALAQATAATATELCALRELMIKVGAGNSNGVDIAVLLPRATPGEARPVAPFFAFADRECAAALIRRSDEIAHELTSVGFVL